MRIENKLGIALSLIERFTFVCVFVYILYLSFKVGSDPIGFVFVFIPGLFVFYGVCKNIIYKPLIRFKNEKFYLRFYLSDVNGVYLNFNERKVKYIILIFCLIALSFLGHQIILNIHNIQGIHSLIFMLECLGALFFYKIFSDTFKTL